MRKTLFCTCSAAALVLGLTAIIQPGFAQPVKARSTIAQSLTPPAISPSRIQDSLIEFPLPKGEEAYGSIDGKKMHRYVEELAQISRRYPPRARSGASRRTRAGMSTASCSRTARPRAPGERRVSRRSA